MPEFTDEALNLVGFWRDEQKEITELRIAYASIMQTLCNKRDEAWRSEAGRNFQIAITELENSCMRAVKGMYSN